LPRRTAWLGSLGAPTGRSLVPQWSETIDCRRRKPVKQATVQRGSGLRCGPLVKLHTPTDTGAQLLVSCMHVAHEVSPCGLAGSQQPPWTTPLRPCYRAAGRRRGSKTGNRLGAECPCKGVFGCQRSTPCCKVSNHGCAVCNARRRCRTCTRSVRGPAPVTDPQGTFKQRLD
jgi:hypothetical protein